MMQGDNAMQLNHATMVAAVQMYVDSLFKGDKAPKVTSVKQVSLGAGMGYIFDVDLAEPEIIEDGPLVIRVSRIEADEHPETASWVAQAMSALAPEVYGEIGKPRSVLLQPSELEGADAPTG